DNGDHDNGNHDNGDHDSGNPDKGDHKAATSTQARDSVAVHPNGQLLSPVRTPGLGMQAGPSDGTGMHGLGTLSGAGSATVGAKGLAPPSDTAHGQTWADLFGGSHDRVGQVQGGPGSTQDNPLYPTTAAGDTYRFTAAGSGQWFDPPTVWGYDYTMTSPGALFTMIELPTGLTFTHPFAVSVGGLVLGTYQPGQWVNFSGFAGGGVREFAVTGINSDGTLFPLWLEFNTAKADFTMTALDPPRALAMAAMDPSGAPEPPGLVLLGIGGAGLAVGALWRRTSRLLKVA
ncbi:MAG TPA: hypothetical protein VG013_11270, partial [Gemmataceae bacterium]|nr:hypothetical protein [Gemmataceae bacterium]